MGFGNNLKGDDYVRKNYIDRFPNINDIINKITLLLAILSLLISIISSFFLRKFVKANIKPETKSKENEDAEDHSK